MKLSRWMSATAVAGIAFTLPTLAYAQTTPDDPAIPAEESAANTGQSGQTATSETIVVTGSRIRRPNLDSAVPVTAIGGDEIFETGQTSVGDLLNELPALRSTFSQANAGRFLGTTGLNLLDLRGLGTNRTLVLVNGRRHVASDILSNGVSPDVNTIPNDLIERVEVVTGGSSAIYGSDAIAGVVNFIMKRDFDGIQIRGQSGIAEYGAAGNQYVSVLAGTNFGDGRGNLTVHGEYAHQDRVFGSDIPFLRRADGFVQIDSDPAGTPNGSDGNPDRVFFRDIRSASIATNGLIGFAQPTNGRCGSGFNTTPFNCNFLFTPEGNLVAQTGSRVGAGQLGSFIGGNGQTNREGALLSVFPLQNRYNFNILAHYTISEAFEPFIEAKVVRVETQGQQSSPAFIQGSSIDANRERIRLDNPFLTNQARGLITSEILASGFRPNLSQRVALTDADRTAIAAGTFRVPIARYLTDLGVRDESSVRDTYRVVAGVRGTFNDDWSYEVSANYGKFRERTTVLGNIDVQRFLLAIDAGRNPATGQIQCRSQFDPAANFDAFGFGADKLAADVAGCVAYNPFGSPNNEAARQYIVRDTTSIGELEQFVASGFISGDSSQLFELPGGPVRFALGAEYRRENAFFQADPIVEQGFTFYNALPTFDPDPFEVKEAFGEIQLPILSNVPFVEELLISGAGRVANYNSGAGTVFAYNAGFEYSPIRSIRFRGNYSRAVRAPNVSETASPLGQNFAPGFQDPCRSQNIGSGTQFRAANCAADLGALLNGSNFANLPAYSLELLSGSNPDLEAETSDSYTIGAVFQPTFLPGFSITVDYYDITVNDVITSPSAQQIVNTCYDLPDLNNQFCALFQRNLGGTNGPNDEVPGQILDTSLEVIPLNYAALQVRGIDVEVAYRRDLGNNTRLDTRFLYSNNMQRSSFTNPAIPDFDNRLLGELGDPRNEFQWNVNLSFDLLTLGYQMRYIDKMYVNLYEDFNSLQGRPPQDADYADIQQYPEVFYHDVRVSVNASEDFNLYLGVDNLLNTQPPFGLTGIGGGSGIYNIRGRNFYVGARANF